MTQQCLARGRGLAYRLYTCICMKLHMRIISPVHVYGRQNYHRTLASSELCGYFAEIVSLLGIQSHHSVFWRTNGQPSC